MLPALPKRPKGAGRWSARTTAVWRAWRADWATSVFTATEVAMAIELAWAWEDYVRDPKPAAMAELRRWMDALGLTPKGKVDLRLRLEDTGPAVATDQGHADDDDNDGQAEGVAPAATSARERYGALRPVG